MKIKVLFLISLAALFSCSRDYDCQDTQESVVVRFAATIEPREMDTKTILDGNSDMAVRHVLWCPNDSIYVSDTDGAKFINTETSYTDTAHFEGKTKRETWNIHAAAYPYQGSKVSSDGETMTVTLPSEQIYVEDGIASDSYPMVAYRSNTGGVFNFKNLCGILVIQLTGTDTVSSIKFSAGSAVAGQGTVSLTQMSYSQVPKFVLKEKLSVYVTLKCPDGVALNPTTPRKFHIVLPPKAFPSFTISVTNTKGGEISLKSTDSLTITRSGRVTTTPSYVDFSYDNLSAKSTSNCYIVSKEGKYKFKATVKGMSTESVGTPVKAEVLWESFGTDVKPQVGDIVRDVSFAHGMVYFTSGRDGNAVIAVKNRYGDILWSWHIWVSAGFDPNATAQVYNDKKGTWMDRNLGAMSAEKGSVGALGLLYQWGRKDPFLGGYCTSYTSEKALTPAVSTGTWEKAVSSTGWEFNEKYSVRHPMQFICGTKSSEYDWCYKGDNSRWRENGAIYDPCPAGWGVPPCIWWEAFHLTTIEDQWTTASNWDATNLGMDFGKTDKTLGTGTIWYPAAGYYEGEMGAFGESLAYVGKTGKYWSTIGYGTDICLAFNYSGWVKPGNTDYNCAHAFSVRCMRL